MGDGNSHTTHERSIAGLLGGYVEQQQQQQQQAWAHPDHCESDSSLCVNSKD